MGRGITKTLSSGSPSLNGGKEWKQLKLVETTGDVGRDGGHRCWESCLLSLRGTLNTGGDMPLLARVFRPERGR